MDDSRKKKMNEGDSMQKEEDLRRRRWIE
jgi:hypothetical protein